MFLYESGLLKSCKNTNYGVTRKLPSIFRFINDLIPINDGNKFGNHYNEIYPPKQILNKENTSQAETTFLDLHLCRNEGQTQTSLYDKMNSCNVNVLRFPYKGSTVPWEMVFATINSEILWICQATSLVVQIIKTSKVFLHQFLRQVADPLGVERVLVKMIDRHVFQFEKYNTNNRDLTQQVLA